MTSTVEYKGDLRTICVHLQSGQQIFTDAPTDNQGKGEAFSPTDLLATSLGSCMLTIMGITANRHQLNLVGTKISITKIMADSPRRVSKIVAEVQIHTDVQLEEKQRTLLENSARACPVAKSLHPDIEQDIRFIYS
jgi:putative redox protein